MSKVTRRIDRQLLLNYIEAVLLKGVSKKDAYLEYVDPDAKNPSQSAAKFERRADFVELYSEYINTDRHELQTAIDRTRRKYARLVESQIDRSIELSDAAKDEKDITKKAQIIRLNNETIQALGVISNPPTATQPGATQALNASGAVI